MTRYTKLDKRKPEYVKEKGLARRSGSPSEDEREASEASTSAVPLEAAEIAKSAADKAALPTTPTDTAATKANIATTATTAPKKELSEPAKLLKRVKLLKLKAKKTNDATRKQDLLRQVREMEQRVNVLNGERGAAKRQGKAKEITNGSGGPAGQSRGPSTTGGGAVNPWKAMEAERRKVTDARSTIRREKREQERMASTRCFACRQMGHSAKDCTENVQLVGGGNGTTPSSSTSKKGAQSNNDPCCYRCGSTEHTLAKCRRPEPQVGPDLPFASCFICGERGHLASKCKQNQGRGIYPNGGCCKLCQSVDHLAKDCHLRINASGVNTISNAAISLGGGGGDAGGADEDDFHHLSRKRGAIEREEKQTNSSHSISNKKMKKVVTF